METYRKDIFASLGISKEFVQDSHSHSVKGVIRGLKFQFDKPTDKLVRVASGSIFAVGVDIRPNSSMFGKWEGVELSSDNKRQLFLPFGFAFGFCVLSESAEVLYKLSEIHNASGSGTIRWDDIDISIVWPNVNPAVNESDNLAPTFNEWKASSAAKVFATTFETRSQETHAED